MTVKELLEHLASKTGKNTSNNRISHNGGINRCQRGVFHYQAEEKTARLKNEVRK